MSKCTKCGTMLDEPVSSRFCPACLTEARENMAVKFYSQPENLKELRDRRNQLEAMVDEMVSMFRSARNAGSMWGMQAVLDIALDKWE